MIASLNGIVISLEEGAAVIEVSGVGYRVQLPSRTLAHWREGQKVQCFTQMMFNPRSGDLTLIGFESQEEMETFRLLLGVSGVGPKAAIAIVDGVSTDILRSAVANEQAEVLQRLPGVGPKTAKRIIFDLKDKLRTVSKGLYLSIKDDLELVEALTALGYSVVEAQAAVQHAPAEGSFEERLKLALTYFAR